MSQTCFHCRLPVPEGADFPVEYQNKREETCCAGCQAVAQSIIHAGLDSYYQHRTQSPDAPIDMPEEFLARLKLYDQAEIQRDFVHEIEQDGERIKEAALILEGITCAACVWLNEQHIQRIKGVISVEINYTSHRARVRWNDRYVQLSTILEAISAIGYRAHPYDLARQENLAQKNRKKALNRLWVAGLSMMQVMMYTVPVYVAGEGGIPSNYLWLLHWANFLLTLPVMFYSAIPFYQGSWRDLKAKRFGMDVPIALAIILTFCASTYALLMNIEQGIYFDSVSMFVFLLLGARYLEAMARQKAGAATENLVRLTPAFCHVMPSFPDSQEVFERTVSALAVGDVVLVKAGESVPADGVILSGESSVNEALLTGESVARPCHVSDRVIAGSVNVESPIVMRVEKTGSETRLAAIVRLLDHAMAQKPSWAILADRVAGHFVAILLLVSVLTFLYWWQIDTDRALWITVAVLVVSCPCALSLATPAALTAATGTLARQGILLTKAAALENMPLVTDIVLDKTGTLTFGQVHVRESWILGEHEPRSLLRTLESHSEHPIARALLAHVGDVPLVPEMQVHNILGKGLEGVDAQGARFRVGTLSFVSEIAGTPPQLPDMWHEMSCVALGGEREWFAVYALGDGLRTDAVKTVNALKQLGLRVHLLSGDAVGSVNNVARTLGIHACVAQALPEDKLAYVERLQSEGCRVLMVGDGVNDAPVLARADVSLAMGGGTDVARASADMVLMGEQIFSLVRAFEMARRTRLLIRQNILWALIYNVLALPLAASGWFANPWFASLGMALSSLLVVSNALRLLRIEER